jgi:hypothetical protein
MPDPSDEDQTGLPVNSVQGPVIRDSQPIEIRSPLEGLDPGRHRIGREGIDPTRDPAPHILRELPEIAGGRWLQIDSVGHGLQPQVLLHLRPRDPSRLLQRLSGGLQVDPILQLLE